MKFGRKLLRPCKYIVLRILKFRFRKRLLVKSRRRHQQQSLTDGQQSPKSSSKRFTGFRSIMHLLRIRRKSRETVYTDLAMELNSSLPSPPPPPPPTVALVNQEKSGLGPITKTTHALAAIGNIGSVDEVEEACRSFEKYLVEMIVEEGKLKDLMDIEQLIYCFNNLRCPVFIDLVSTFYGQLCKDLFYTNN